MARCLILIGAKRSRSRFRRPWRRRTHGAGDSDDRFVVRGSSGLCRRCSPLPLQGLHRRHIPGYTYFYSSSLTALGPYQPKGLGRFQNSDDIRRHIHLAAINAGLGTIRPHDFRHTHALMLIAKGANIKAVSHRLRHTSIQTTLNLYGHLYPDDQQAVADIADRVFKFE